MKYLLIIWFSLISYIGISQYTLVDNFNSIGGVNEWYIATGYGSTSGMGIDGGNLCYNVSPLVYINSNYYSFQSPDYGTKFKTDKCKDLTITFKVTVDIRSSDFFIFYYYSLGTWHSYDISSNGTYTYVGVFPNTVQYFSFDFITGSYGSKSGRYVHIDYFSIDCGILLPIELYSFQGTNQQDQNILYWKTASETNNDYFLLDHSTDGINWNTIANISSVHNSTQNTTYSYIDHNFTINSINYYRLSQVDLDGTVVVFDHLIVAIDNFQKIKTVIKVVNTLGQQVDIDAKGLVILIFEDGTMIKKYN